MTNSAISTQQIYSHLEDQQQDNYVPNCILKWRQGQLLVSLVEGQLYPPYLPALENQQLLGKCLKRSQVRLVRIDPALGEAKLLSWAEAGLRAAKPVFLKLPHAHELSRNPGDFSWWLKRLINAIAAILLLLALSPLMLLIVFLMRPDSPKSIFCGQWHVGERGKLFRILKFRTTVENRGNFDYPLPDNQKGLDKHGDSPYITPLGNWMSKYGIDELPQLFNVLRGEMTLFGARPCNLNEALQLSSQEQRQLNALPGITGAWQWKGVQTSFSH